MRPALRHVASTATRAGRRRHAGTACTFPLFAAGPAPPANGPQLQRSTSEVASVARALAARCDVVAWTDGASALRCGGGVLDDDGT